MNSIVIQIFSFIIFHYWLLQIIEYIIVLIFDIKKKLLVKPSPLTICFLHFRKAQSSDAYDEGTLTLPVLTSTGSPVQSGRHTVLAHFLSHTPFSLFH